ncbi:hypothetical protein OUZ56_001554 [Daphnia magna]|uniref:Uncharacterized protein n=1 Tax=Daphnia magna TaxID=35525 RepID=A0ABR0A3I2_9CRUS|nr:hypothetical protein OUZ56_001554 [Daphnia magna]
MERKKVEGEMLADGIQRKSNEARREKGERPQGYLPTPEAKRSHKAPRRPAANVRIGLWRESSEH